MDSASQMAEQAATQALVIRMDRVASVDLARVPRILGDRSAPWLGELTAESSGMRTFVCDLHLRVSPDGHSLFRKSALVGLGEIKDQGQGYLVPVEWRAATLAPLFPVFAGSLRLYAHMLTLEGYYAPPFGVLGQTLDRTLLRIAARGTLRWFLASVETALREG